MSIALGNAPRIDPLAERCVRYSEKLRRYELVVDGEIVATISRFAWEFRQARARFVEKVAAYLDADAASR